MSKVFVLCFLAISPSFAALVTCAPAGNGKISDNGVLAAQSFTCSPSALAGNLPGDGLLITGIEVVVTVNGSNPQDDDVPFAVVASTTNIVGLTNPAAITLSCLADFDGCTAGPLSSSATTVFGPTDFFPAFSITVTGGLLQPNASILNSATASVQYQAIPAGVPEPGAVVLLGSALVALGVFRRRR